MSTLPSRVAASAGSWTSLGTAQQIALVDEVYRAGRVWAGVAGALRAAGGPDEDRAGFALVVSQPIPRAGSVRLRVEAKYQDLLWAHAADLGEVVQVPLR